MHIQPVDARICMLKMQITTYFLIQHCVSHMYLNICHYFQYCCCYFAQPAHTCCNCLLYNFNTPLFPFLHHILSFFAVFYHWKANFPHREHSVLYVLNSFGHNVARMRCSDEDGFTQQKNVLRPSFHALLSPDWSPSLGGQPASAKLSHHNSSKSTINSNYEAWAHFNSDLHFTRDLWCSLTVLKKLKQTIFRSSDLKTHCRLVWTLQIGQKWKSAVQGAMFALSGFIK